MTETELQLEKLKAQIRVIRERIRYERLRISSGAYKFDQIKRKNDAGEMVAIGPDEKLERSFQTVYAHIRIMDEFTDAILKLGV